MVYSNSPADDAKRKEGLARILVDMILRRDRCFYRETIADSSTKPRKVADCLIIVIEQDVLIFGQDTRVIERGGGRRGVVEAWLSPSSKYRLSYWQGIPASCQTSIPSASCQLLTSDVSTRPRV